VLKQLKGISADRLSDLTKQALPDPPAPDERRQARGAPPPTDTRPSAASGAADAPLAGSTANGAPAAFDLFAALPRSKGASGKETWLKALSSDTWQERKAACDQLVQLLAGHDAVSARAAPRCATRTPTHVHSPISFSLVPCIMCACMHAHSPRSGAVRWRTTQRARPSCLPPPRPL
jgi:hypothetical protein